MGRQTIPIGQCWVYQGREPLDDVRRFVVVTFDPEYPITPETVFERAAGCVHAGCVRPPHLVEVPRE